MADSTRILTKNEVRGIIAELNRMADKADWLSVTADGTPYEDAYFDWYGEMANVEHYLVPVTAYHKLAEELEEHSCLSPRQFTDIVERVCNNTVRDVTDTMTILQHFHDMIGYASPDGLEQMKVGQALQHLSDPEILQVMVDTETQISEETRAEAQQRFTMLAEQVVEERDIRGALLSALNQLYEDALHTRDGREGRLGR